MPSFLLKALFTFLLWTQVPRFRLACTIILPTRGNLKQPCMLFASPRQSVRNAAFVLCTALVCVCVGRAWQFVKNAQTPNHRSDNLCKMHREASGDPWDSSKPIVSAR